MGNSSSGSVTPRCNAVRAAVEANACGACAPDVTVAPAGCATNALAACNVFSAANSRALEAKIARDPWALLAGGDAAAARTAALSDLEAGIAASDTAIEAAFPGGSGASWADIGRCRVPGGGSEGIPTYFGRGPLAAWYKPAPLLGSPFAYKVWRPAGDGAPPNPPVPLWTDAIIGVDGLTAIVAVFLVLLALALATQVPAVRAFAARLRSTLAHPFSHDPPTSASA